MKKIIIILWLSIAFVGHAYAANWTKLQDNKHARLLLDKQSIATSGKHQKAWVKIDYKTLQTNMQYPDKNYNNAKLLWYFKCDEQQSATAQVYQLLDEELVFSAAIDIKRARFLEPVPETEVDIAMHYVCRQKAYKEAAKARQEKAKEAAKNKAAAAPGAKTAKPAPIAKPAPEVKEAKKETAEKKAPEKEEGKGKAEKDDGKAKKADAGKDEDKKKKLVKRKRRAPSWKYQGKKGPEFWGELSEDYATCKTGRNQSPINIEKTIATTPKKLKTFQRFPVTTILNNGHSVQANFKPGNIMVVDGVMYQMKQVHFHAPSENQIMGESYPLEAHFVHADPSGNLAVLAVMFEEGHENKALAKLWRQMPKRKGKPKKLTSKVLAGELIPRKKFYYRFSGSLTTPPCSEGVVWVVMKKTMTASSQQISAFKKIMKHDNNRPIQPLNGRMVIE